MGLQSGTIEVGYDPRMFGVAYVITNTVNNKKYVGVSKNHSVRWKRHKAKMVKESHRHLYRAMNKYGAENFTFEVIASAKSYEDLCELEKILIVQYNTFSNDGFGYNLTRGGDGQYGRKPSEETKRKMSEAQKGKIKTAEHLKKIGDSQPKTKKKSGPRTPEFKKMLSEKFAGRKPSEQTRLAQIAALTGKKHDEARRKQTSENLKLRVRKPETFAKISESLKGRVITDEWKEKMKEGHKRNAQEKREKENKNQGDLFNDWL